MYLRYNMNRASNSKIVIGQIKLPKRHADLFWQNFGKARSKDSTRLQQHLHTSPTSWYQYHRMDATLEEAIRQFDCRL
jgi:hypothetical protein